MNKKELSAALETLDKARQREAKIKAEIEALQRALKGHLTAIHADELTHDGWKIAWKDFQAERLDVGRLQKELPNIAAAYTRTTTGKRFTVQKFA